MTRGITLTVAALALLLAADCHSETKKTDDVGGAGGYGGYGGGIGGYGGYGGTGGDSCGSCTPESNTFDGTFPQVTIIVDPAVETCTTHPGFLAGDTIVIDDNGDGTYAGSFGPDWSSITATEGTVIDEGSYWAWADIPADTLISVTLTHTASGITVIIELTVVSTGVTVASVCYQPG